MIAGVLVFSQKLPSFTFAQTTPTISLDSKITYQTISGWEGTDTFGGIDYPNDYLKWRDTAADKVVNELGINKVRLELISGTENPVDYFTPYITGQQPKSYWGTHKEEIINDNSDPNVINLSGFQFATLDFRIEEVVLPMKQRVETNGEKLYVNLNYVDFDPSAFEHAYYPAEYAELILVTFQHMQSKYGFVPDTVEIILEPDNTSGIWTAPRIGAALQATGDRLKAAGFTPEFIASCTMWMDAASTYFDQIIGVAGVSKYLKEISYHRYCGVSDTALMNIVNRATSYGMRTGMHEHIGSSYQDLHKDLTLGRNSTWQQFTLAYPGSDTGGNYYYIDMTNPTVVNIGSRTKFLRQYFKFIRSGAQRIEATTINSSFNPVAFINTDGKYVVVVQTGGSGSFSIGNLPQGTYGITYTAGSEYNKSLADLSITTGQTLTTSIPQAGVITIYQKSTSTPSTPTPTPTVTPPTGPSPTPPSGTSPIDTLQPGYWYEVPNSNLSTELPSPLPPNSSGPGSIMNAWNGGAYDTKRDRLIVWGGGHADYGGNEIYVFDINTLKWTRIWGPSANIPPIGSTTTEAYPDGSPAARHTYEALEYIPSLDGFFTAGGSLYSSGGASNGVWVFDFNTLTWTRKTDIPTGQAFYGIVSGYNPTTGGVLWQGQYKFFEYDPTKDKHTAVGNEPSGGWWNGNMTGAYDKDKNMFVAVGQGAVRVWNLTTKTYTNSQITTGGNAVVNALAPGFEYDPVLKKFVGWAGDGTGSVLADVYSLDTSTWQWSLHSPAGGNTVIPTARAQNGTFGRFRYIPSKNAYVVVNSINSNIYFYKLSSGGVVPTTPITPSAIPTTTLTPTPTPAPNVVLTKSADKTAVVPGDTITYTLTYQNTGTADAQNVVITDTIPVGSTYIVGSATGGGSINGTQISWTLPSLATGIGGSVSFQVQALLPTTPTPTTPPPPTGNLNVLLTVKETVGVSQQAYPISVVVPLPFGTYQNTSVLRVVDSTGNTTPAQIDMLNRWTGRDNSIRNVKIEFQPTVTAFTGGGTGKTEYYLKDDATGPTTSSLSVQETTSDITVMTGPLKFIVQKKNFNLLDEVWKDTNGNGTFESTERIVAKDKYNGGVMVGQVPTDVQYDADRTDTSVLIEEQGPMRVVIRAEALTHYNSTTKAHTHGFATRIYAYAGKPYVKVDYQLQNSSKDEQYAAPLYFDEANINLKLDMGANPTVKVGLPNGAVYQRTKDTGLYLAQDFHDSAKVYDKALGTPVQSVTTSQTDLANHNDTRSFIDIRDGNKGITATTRYFWETWPNGLEIDANNVLSLQLFPRWSAHWDSTVGSKTTNITGLYWLEDMQHKYKEMMLYFHDGTATDTELKNLTNTFTYHPVAVVDTAWYQQTQGTLDIGGLIPQTALASSDIRRDTYSADDFLYTDPNKYRFHYTSFYHIDPYRIKDPAGAGNWPYGIGEFIATGNPSDYFRAEKYGIGEINIHPQWIAGYTDPTDASLQLGIRLPFGSPTWRVDGNAPTYLAGTYQRALPRDDQHGWWYHIEQSYSYSANPWIADWYRFMKEYRKTLVRSRGFDWSSRAMGHNLATMVQALRVTGDTTLIATIKDFILYTKSLQLPQYGFKYSDPIGEATFQAGFLTREIIDYMEEIRYTNLQNYAEAFGVLAGMMEWNINFSDFAYYIDATKGQTGPSSGSSLTFVDPQMWYYWNTGKQQYLTHVNQYIDTGLNGGSPPYGTNTSWYGQWEGRYSTYVRGTIKTDLTPPSQITDLTATIVGSNIQLNWTPAQDAVRYHIVYGDKPISATSVTDTGFTNWWAATAFGTTNTTSYTFTPANTTTPVYVAIFAIDQNNNMSIMSNVSLAK